MRNVRLIPRLAEVFGTDTGTVGLAVPAYLLPYGLATLIWGPLSDRIGRRAVILTSLGLFTVLTAATAAGSTATAFVLLRLATGLGASGIVPIALALIADLVAFERRGRALGWLFGAMASGIAVGSTAGALAEPVIGWPGLFLVVAALGAVVAVACVALGAVPRLPTPASPPSLRAVGRGYRSLLALPRARRTYGYVLLNAVLHGGVFT